MRGDLRDRLQAVNETWEEMEDSFEGDGITKCALSRAVRQATKSTKSAFDQIDAFQQEWQEKVDCEKQSIVQRQNKQHPTQASVSPSREHFDRPNNTKFGLIPAPSRVTPHENLNNNTSCPLPARKDGHIKKKMPKHGQGFRRSSQLSDPVIHSFILLPCVPKIRNSTKILSNSDQQICRLKFRKFHPNFIHFAASSFESYFCQKFMYLLVSIKCKMKSVKAICRLLHFLCQDKPSKFAGLTPKLLRNCHRN